MGEAPGEGLKGCGYGTSGKTLAAEGRDPMEARSSGYMQGRSLTIKGKVIRSEVGLRWRR